MSGHAPAAPHSSWGPRAGGTEPQSVLHRASLVELFPSGPAATQKHWDIRMSPQLCRDSGRSQGLDVLRGACSGTVPSWPPPQLKSAQVPPLPCRHLSQEFPIPFPRKELAPMAALLCGRQASDPSLFRKSITMVCTEELRVCFFRHNIFKPLESCLLQRTLQPLAASMGQDEFFSVQAASMGQAQDEFFSVQAAPAARRGSNSQCRCATAVSHWAQPAVCSSGVMLPGKSCIPQPGCPGMLTGSCGKYRVSALCTVCWASN